MSEHNSNSRLHPLRWLIPAVLLALSFVLLLAAFQPSQPEPERTVLPTGNPVAVSEPVEEVRSILVIDEGGRICVYEGDTLLISTEIPVASLPLEDRVALREGITVQGEQELTRLLEDLGS